MACKALRLLTFPQQRDDPISTQSSWVKTDTTAALNDTMYVRSRIPVENDGGTDCTGWLHFQVRVDGSSWKEWDSAKNVDSVLWTNPVAGWQAKLHTFRNTGTHEFRVWLEYDGSDWYSDTITVEVAEAWTETPRSDDTWTEPASADDTWTETARSDDTWTETSRSDDSWTEPSSGGDSWTEEERYIE